MEKKANPWVASLKKKKAAVDLHPDVLRAVLKMNPEMRGGDRSTEEVGQALMRDLPQPSAPKQVDGIESDRLRTVLSDMLKSFAQELDARVAALAAKRKALDEEEKGLNDSFVARIVEFLAEVQPGPLSSDAKDILQQHSVFLRKLKVEVADVGRRLRDATASGSR